jgi:osmotically-inducible protein OsmY
VVTSPVLILGGALLSGCADYRGSSTSTYAKDAAIAANVESAIARHRDLDPPNEIYVSTSDHKVYLSGIVNSGLSSEDAEELARQVDGVTQVVNDIAVSQ